MFIVSIKPQKGKLLLYLIFGMIVILSLCILLAGQDEAGETAAKVDVTAENNSQRIAFLSSFGWEVEEDAFEIVEILIPNNFGDVYQVYNQIQKAQGFDLEDYAGQRAKRYTYRICNYPGEKEARANLLVFRGKVIGGDVCSVELDGFMHGFALPG